MFPLTAGVTSLGRLIEIRMFEERHADELFRLIEANRPSLRQWLPWLDWSNSPADTAEHIRHSLERYRDSNGFSAGIYVDNELAGAIGLHAVDSLHRSSSIGYWLSREFPGPGNHDAVLPGRGRRRVSSNTAFIASRSAAPPVMSRAAPSPRAWASLMKGSSGKPSGCTTISSILRSTACWSRNGLVPPSRR